MKRKERERIFYNFHIYVFLRTSKRNVYIFIYEMNEWIEREDRGLYKYSLLNVETLLYSKKLERERDSEVLIEE